MVLYKCYCNYQTSKRSSMINYLNKIKSCIPGKNMSLIDIDLLRIEGQIYENLSDLSEEDKKERRRIQKMQINLKFRSKKDIKHFAKSILTNLNKNSEKRNYEKPSWSFNDIIELLNVTVHI